MKKTLVVIALALAAIVFVGAFLLLWWAGFARDINDNHAEKVYREYFEELLPADFVIEDSVITFRNNKQLNKFIGIVSVAVYTELTETEVNEKIKQTYGDVSPLFWHPYDLELANALDYTGIQKEMVFADKNGHYLLYVVIDPKLKWESRNK